ncbi:MAG: SlyX family protein [Pseudomonadales bacterium]
MGKHDDISWLKEQVVDLQSQLAFQEDTIQALNTVVTRQQQQIEQLNELCNSQKSQLEHMASEMEGGVTEEKPPHY